MDRKNKKLGSSFAGAQGGFPLTRETLVKLKQKAWRRGCWFKDLKQNERMLLDLTIRVVQQVHSFRLAKIVSDLIIRLCEAMGSSIYRLARTEGLHIAKKLSGIATSWGNRAEKRWGKDRGFMQYLVINNLVI
jgi:hypothetical protein